MTSEEKMSGLCLLSRIYLYIIILMPLWTASFQQVEIGIQYRYASNGLRIAYAWRGRPHNVLASLSPIFRAITIAGHTNIPPDRTLWMMVAMPTFFG